MFDGGIVAWASAFTVMTAIGVVLLVSGSLATFWVEVTSGPQLEEQRRGFKSMFNAEAVSC